MSKTQIDRLGDRLKKGTISEADLQLLDQYRRSFAEAFDFLVRTIRKELALEPTGRPAKSTSSISEKLRRESIRLTQIQDIAGCRLIVPDIAKQEIVVQSLQSLFEDTTIIDRRQQPSHGYRAVHVIVNCLDKMVEIQIRTSLQHLWAELSEKLSDVLDPAIKYGGGDEDDQKLLAVFSSSVARVESLEVRLTNLEIRLADLQREISVPSRLVKEKVQEELVYFREELRLVKQGISEHLHKAIQFVEEFKTRKDRVNDLSH